MTTPTMATPSTARGGCRTTVTDVTDVEEMGDERGARTTVRARRREVAEKKINIIFFWFIFILDAEKKIKINKPSLLPLLLHYSSSTSSSSLVSQVAFTPSTPSRQSTDTVYAPSYFCRDAPSAVFFAVTQ